MSFTEMYVSRRKLKSEFFTQINTLINWKEIEVLIKQYYNKGFSVAGRPSYPGLLLFKMALLQTWYGLSDYEVEDRINDSLSFMQFVGLSLDDEVPDHSVLSRFRTTLTQKNGYEALMTLINTQLTAQDIILRQGAIVDASITDSPRKPRGKKEYEDVTEDRSEPESGTQPASEPAAEDKSAPKNF